ncbi:Copia protein [Vitis vinifera]|uniref:Copia protein n=1 Tax=Vitis vinifera TaxID=29760 RepID=A0A438FNW7_VITVI|nr:Copia protein [Vitis vinifera]
MGYANVMRISHNTLWNAKFSHNLEQLASEGHIFLISAPNRCERRLQLLSSLLLFTLLAFPLCFSLLVLVFQLEIQASEAKYIAAGSCLFPALWIKQMLRDYGIDQGTMVVFCDNTSAINISKNPVLHSRTEHIDIRHHFIRDLVEDKVVSLEYVPTEGQIADILTKPLDVSRFESLRNSIVAQFVPSPRALERCVDRSTKIDTTYAFVSNSMSALIWFNSFGLMNQGIADLVAPSRHSVSRAYRDQYTKVYRQRSLVLERQLHLESFLDTPIPDLFVELGWLPLANFTGSTCAPIVRMFYSNIIEHDLDESYLQSSLFGIVVKVTPKIIVEVLGILLVQAPSMSDLEITSDLLDRVSIDLWGEFIPPLIGQTFVRMVAFSCLVSFIGNPSI